MDCTGEMFHVQNLLTKQGLKVKPGNKIANYGFKMATPQFLTEDVN